MTEVTDGDTLTTITGELTGSDLALTKILSQVYDGASLMSGKNAVQKLLKDNHGQYASIMNFN